MKGMMVLGLVVGLIGCGTITQRMATMEESGRILGTTAVRYVVDRHGVHSRKAEDVAQIGQSLDQAATLLAADQPVSAEDTIEIENVVRGLVEVIQGDPLEDEQIGAAAGEALGAVLGLLRDSLLSSEARTLAARFCVSAARAIYMELDSQRQAEVDKNG